MKFFLSNNAREFSASLARYSDETGKSMAQVLAREGPDFRTELFNQFRKLHPQPDSIFNDAQRRGFRVLRVRNTALVRTQNGVSQRALRRATEILGNQKSDLFRPLGSRLVPVRFSGRRHRNILQGGRSGRRFAKSALHRYQLSTEEFAHVRQTQNYQVANVRRLNLRALSVYLELRYRRRGSHGGTMAVQWLFKEWRRNGYRFSARARLVQRSATGIPIGTVDFEMDGKGRLQTISFTGYVPGTAEQAQKHGILESVFSARSSRLLNAIKLHHAKAARQHGF